MLYLALPGPWASAQAPAAPKSDKAEAAFDDEKPATKDKAPAKPSAGGASDRDKISFTQENAAAQMTELEERMFRLAEALRGLEPENASRLRLALKFSREELILEQMRDTHKMLKEAQLAKAETEIRELLAKLEHLRNVLLAEDLDFQLKLARLRQMRETLSQLERIVKDQRRELGWSRFAVDQRKAKERLAARRPDLEALARDQKKVVDDTRALSAEKSGDRATARAAPARSRGGHRQGRFGTRRRSRVRRLPAVAIAQGRDAPGRRHGRASVAKTMTWPGPSPPRRRPKRCSSRS